MGNAGYLIVEAKDKKAGCFVRTSGSDVEKKHGVTKDRRRWYRRESFGIRRTAEHVYVIAELYVE